MNVLWFSHLVPYPPQGGVLQRSFNLLREVAKYHKVYLLAFNQKAILPDARSVEDALHQLETFCYPIEVLPIPSDQKPYGRPLLYCKSLFTRRPYTANWLLSREMGATIGQVVKQYGIDVVHFDTISLAPYLDAAQRCKKVLNHHNIESDMMLQRARNERNVAKKIYMYQEGQKLRVFETHVCPKFDLNLTCSELDRDRLQRHIPGLEVEVIANGVDLNYFAPLNSANIANSLVFAGGLKWYPNRNAMTYFAKQIWPLLKAAIPNVNITVIGQSPPALLRGLAERDEKFRVAGFVEDVRPFIERASVYICPITDSGGTKLKILDALAMGKAIVAHPVACEGIDVVDGESVLLAEKPQEYVERIKQLFGDHRLRKQLGENGRRLVTEKYSYTQIGRKLAELYGQL